MTVKMKLLNATILAAITSTAHAEQQKHHFDIPAQALGSALQTFAAQSGAPMLYAEQTAAGKQSPRLSGDYTTAEAAAKLLAGSGLVHSVAENGAVTVKPAASASPVTLKPMTVTGKTEDDPKSYIATRTSSATKTDTPIMQTPQSIQVIKRALIDDQQNITISESLRNVSGVVPNNPAFTPAGEMTMIRGFKAEQLVDGFTQYRNAGDRESTVNVERLEVLKGTNGVLYSGGSGSPVGGLINIVSKLPNAVASREVGFKAGNNSYYQPYVDINQPLTKNILTRFTGEYTNAGSYLDNINTERYNLNPTVTFTNNDTTSFTLQGKVSRWEQQEYPGLPAIGTIAGNFSIPRTAFLGPADMPNSRSESNAVWGTFDHKFNNIWSVNLKARYSQSEFDEKLKEIFGADGFIADRPATGSTWFLYNTDMLQKQEEWTFLGNATAKFDVGPTKNTVLIGADHSDLDDRGYMDYAAAGSVDLSKLSFNQPYGRAGAGIDNMFVKNVTYGGYTQLQSTIYDRLHLLASLRAAHVDTDYTTLTGINSSGGKTKFLPRAGGVFDLTDEFSLFVNYSEGMMGQTFKNFVGAPQPEESTTIEGGLKFNIAHQLTGQIAGYQIDRTNVAVTDSADLQRRSKAAGQQRSRGVETDLTWQATDALSILANYAHTDAEFTDSLAGVPAGNKLAAVPANSGRLWVDYRFQQPDIKGLSVGGGVYAQGQAYLSNNNAFKSDAYHSFDASIAYEYQRYKLAATVKNLTNEHYFQAYNYLGGHVIPSDGTSAYVTGSVKF
ncbi:TonB-dependent siderophore receptor [Candidatus Methylobacter oryzae]|nr:TonB-dependent receptor [Candidatus Methylobacter oryzae]